MLLFWQSKITHLWQVNLYVNVQFPMLTSCLNTILNTQNLMKKQAWSVETASRALQLFLSDYTTLASAHYLILLTDSDGQPTDQNRLFSRGQSEQNMTNLQLTWFSKSVSQAAPSIYSGCHSISRHAFIAFPAEIQYIPNESHSADLTLTGHSAQLSDQHNPSTVVNSEEKKRRKKGGTFHLLYSIAR